MKRIICLVLILSLLCGCGGEKKYSEPVSFYYPRAVMSYGTNDSIFVCEQAEGSGYEEDLMTLLDLYLRGPSSSGMRSPFPSYVRVLSLSQTDGLLSVTLSDQIARLTGLELSIACAAFSLTCMELTGAEAVEIRAQSQLLDGEQSIVMTEESILTLDAPVDAFTDEQE